ncbi:SDR family oxidoreductase [Patescibacteria group bacterium]|nr:SDR family oxidoreductase [Patescibacteria group bacterium]
MARRILITGATGLVGGHLGAQLISGKDELFFLARDSSSESAEERVQKNLKLVNPLVLPSNYSVIKGNITEKNCGVNIGDLERLGIKKIIHAAASVNFDGKNAAMTWETNLLGTKNILSLAQEIGAELYYISTVYVETERNAYEASKAEAERAVQKSGLPWYIIRLPIIVGDSQNGDLRHHHYNGFYGIGKLFHRLAQRIREKRGYGGVVSIPVYLNHGDSTLNLCPIDWVIKMIVELIGAAESMGKVVSIAHPNPPKVKDVMQAGFAALHIEDVRYWDFKLGPHPTSGNSTQRIVYREMGRYFPYITSEEPFGSSVFAKETRRVLGGSYKDPINITPAFIQQLLQIAVERNFGDSDNQ